MSDSMSGPFSGILRSMDGHIDWMNRANERYYMRQDQLDMERHKLNLDQAFYKEGQRIQSLNPDEQVKYWDTENTDPLNSAYGFKQQLHGSYTKDDRNYQQKALLTDQQIFHYQPAMDQMDLAAKSQKYARDVTDLHGRLLEINQDPEIANQMLAERIKEGSIDPDTAYNIRAQGMNAWGSNQLKSIAMQKGQTEFLDGGESPDPAKRLSPAEQKLVQQVRPFISTEQLQKIQSDVKVSLVEQAKQNQEMKKQYVDQNFGNFMTQIIRNKDYSGAKQNLDSLKSQGLLTAEQVHTAEGLLQSSLKGDQELQTKALSNLIGNHALILRDQGMDAAEIKKRLGPYLQALPFNARIQMEADIEKIGGSPEVKAAFQRIEEIFGNDHPAQKNRAQAMITSFINAKLGNNSLGVDNRADLMRGLNEMYAGWQKDKSLADFDSALGSSDTREFKNDLEWGDRKTNPWSKHTEVKGSWRLQNAMKLVKNGTDISSPKSADAMMIVGEGTKAWFEPWKDQLLKQGINLNTAAFDFPLGGYLIDAPAGHPLALKTKADGTERWKILAKPMIVDGKVEMFYDEPVIQNGKNTGLPTTWKPIIKPLQVYVEGKK